MTVIVSLSIAAEEFPLGRVFEVLPTARIELDRVIPRGEALFPYAWVYGERADTVRTAIEADDHVRRVDVLNDLPDRTLVRLEWEPTVDGLVEAIADQEAAILDANGDADRWRFHLRFPDADATSAFQQRCHDAGLTVEITTVHDTTQGAPDRSDELTAGQREVVEHAVDTGYFEIPRETTLGEVGEELGVSDQAVSERLRRAQKRVFKAYLGK